MSESEVAVEETQPIHDGDGLQPAKESLRRGWEEAMTGKTRPVSELWDDINAE